MRKDLRSVIIANLAQKYGTPFVRPEGDGIVVRHTDFRRGGVIYHIPAELLPDHDINDFTDPIAGYEMPELVGLVYPELQAKAHGTIIKVGCVSRYDSTYDAVALRSIMNVTFCPPDKTNYLFITVENVDRKSELSNYIFSSADKITVWCTNRTLGHQGQSQSWIMLLRAGFRLTQERRTAKATSYYAAQTRIVAAAYMSGTTPPAVKSYKEFMATHLDEPDDTEAETTPQPANTQRSYDYSSTVTTTDGQLNCHSFHFADDMSGEQTWVITPEGYLLKPTRIQDHSEVIFGEIAQFEIWKNVNPDALIIHWKRESFHGENQCKVLHQPECLTGPQWTRVRWIEAKIRQSWRGRKHPLTGQDCNDSGCNWGDRMANGKQLGSFLDPQQAPAEYGPESSSESED